MALPFQILNSSPDTLFLLLVFLHKFAVLHYYENENNYKARKVLKFLMYVSLKKLMNEEVAY